MYDRAIEVENIGILSGLCFRKLLPTFTCTLRLPLIPKISDVEIFEMFDNHVVI